MEGMHAGRVRWLALLLGVPLWLCWCLQPVHGASGPVGGAGAGAGSGATGGAGGGAAAITAITLERDCSGCPEGTVLVLRRDGTALLTTTGKARLGTQDRVLQGTVAAADFDALARRLHAQGYFAMDEVYEEPGLQDGAWTTLSVTRGGVDKRVFSREQAGPPALRALQAAVDAVQAGIAFAAPPR